jgi:hypothetical protein
MKIFYYLNFILVIFAIIYQVNLKKFRYYSYKEIWDIFRNLAKTCPFIKIDSSQNRYKLPFAGNCHGQPCENLIVFMTDFNSMTVDKPQVYISGLLHGDEVLGASTLTELALYFCESTTKEQWVVDLLKSRYIVYTPFTNAYGYANGLREDYILRNDSSSTFDPNRDFPYFNSKSETISECMQTVTARTVNELFREHLFIQTLTFHGGINAIGYPWGNFIHKIYQTSTPCPDCSAAYKIGIVLQRYSGSANNRGKGITDYTLADMTTMVFN